MKYWQKKNSDVIETFQGDVTWNPELTQIRVREIPQSNGEIEQITAEKIGLGEIGLVKIKLRLKPFAPKHSHYTLKEHHQFRTKTTISVILTY